MSAADHKGSRKEEKDRRKKLLRTFREEEHAGLWNRILDEIGPCSEDDPEVDCSDCCQSYRISDFEVGDLDEDYPNKAETMHNIFECD